VAKVSQATILIRLVEERGVELFHTPNPKPYASIVIDGHRETWPLRSSSFNRWLRREFYLEEGTAPNNQAISDALGVLEGQAEYGGPEWPVAVRLAECPSGICLDLGEATWQAVEIGPGGWKVVAIPSVRFTRPRGLQPLPVPERGGRLSDIQRFLNVGDRDFILLLAWELGALRPTGPYPPLNVSGEQGTAKSTALRVLRRLIDPNKADLRSEPRDPIDLMIAAQNGWVIAYDNLSFLPARLSDCLCRLATGVGFGTRQLYTDDEEMLFESMRPILCNGIEVFATRADFIDRSILVTLEQIPKQRRREEKAFWQDFYQARPKLLGALLTAVSTGLANVDHVRIPDLPRMADFATWAFACLGDDGPAFLEAYRSNRADANDLPLEADLIVPPLWAVAQGAWSRGKDWVGTASELLAALATHVDEKAQRRKDWPPDGRRLSGRLRRLAPNLRNATPGLDVVLDEKRARNGRLVFLREVTPPDTPGQPKTFAENQGNAASPASTQPPRAPSQIQIARQSARRGVVLVDAEVDDSAAIVSTSASTPASPLQRRAAASVESENPSDSNHGDGADAGDGEIPTFSYCLTAPVQDAAQPLTGNLITVASDADMDALVAALGNASVVALDTETTGLDPLSDRLCLLQLATEDSVYLVDALAVNLAPLGPFLAAGTGPLIVGHHLKFDCSFLAASGLPVPPGERLHDTYLTEQLLDAGNARGPGYYTLAALVERRLGWVMDKAEQQSDWSTRPLSEEQRRYAARDVAVLANIVSQQRAELADAGLERVFSVEMDCLPAIVWLEKSGIPFDTERWRALANAANAEANMLLAELNAPAGTESTNWRSPKKVHAVFHERGQDLTDTTSETLTAVAGAEPLAGLLLRYREATKRAGTYGPSLGRAIRPPTHPARSCDVPSARHRLRSDVLLEAEFTEHSAGPGLPGLLPTATWPRTRQGRFQPD
jgi:hypothetical protein